jgi:hypothetical protein
MVPLRRIYILLKEAKSILLKRRILLTNKGKVTLSLNATLGTLSLSKAFLASSNSS